MTLTSLSELRIEFKKAKESNAESFVLKGHTLLTDYAKYLIQYLEMRKTPPSLPIEFVPK